MQDISHNAKGGKAISQRIFILCHNEIKGLSCPTGSDDHIRQVLAYRLIPWSKKSLSNYATIKQKQTSKQNKTKRGEHKHLWVFSKRIFGDLSQWWCDSSEMSVSEQSWKQTNSSLCCQTENNGRSDRRYYTPEMAPSLFHVGYTVHFSGQPCDVGTVVTTITWVMKWRFTKVEWLTLVTHAEGQHQTSRVQSRNLKDAGSSTQLPRLQRSEAEARERRAAQRTLLRKVKLKIMPTNKSTTEDRTKATGADQSEEIFWGFFVCFFLLFLREQDTHIFIVQKRCQRHPLKGMIHRMQSYMRPGIMAEERLLFLETRQEEWVKEREMMLS